MNVKELSDLQKFFVSLDRYTPVEKIVYGTAGLMLSSIVLSLVYLVIKK